MDLSFRFCPRCGEPLFHRLDSPNPSLEDFIPLLNSLYNLLAVTREQPPNPDRRHDLPELSEKVMARRSRIEHEEGRRHLRWSTITRPVADLLSAEETMMELYTLSLSNALAGYAYRSIEEMVCRRRSPRIPEAKKAIFFNLCTKKAVLTLPRARIGF